MVLDTIDAAIERTGAVIWKLKQVRAGLLHDLLTRGLDDNGELRDPDKHPEQFQDSPMGRIPKAWRLGVLDNLVLPDRPIVYGILMPGKGFRNGVPVIKVKDIRDGNIDESNLLLTDPKIDAAYLRSKVRARDLLFTIRGTVGRMAVVPASLDGANITQDTARISLANASPIFVARWLDSFHPKRFVSVHTLGVAVQGINLRDVRNIPAPIVDSYEQEVIVEKINEVERNIDETRCFLSKLQSIKSGLMSDLLTGRVAVPPKISVGVTHGIN
jgi:type I restriction enzyme S subunit